MELICSNPLLKQGHPEQAAHKHVQTVFEYLQDGRRLQDLPGQPVPVLIGKNGFLMLKGNLLCSSLCPFLRVLSLGTTEESSFISALSLQVFMYIDETPGVCSFPGAPISLSSLWPFTGLSPVCPCLPGAGESSIGHSTLDLLAMAQDTICLKVLSLAHV